jgi:hypothetical protein
MITLGKQKFIVPVPHHMRTWALQQRLFPVAGNLAAAFVVILGKSDLRSILESEIIQSLPTALPHLGRVFADLPAGELEQITRILLGDPKAGAKEDEVATCDGVALFSRDEGDAFDTILRGRTMDTWRLLVHAMGVHYPDFFVLAQPLVEAVNKGRASEGSSTSPTSGLGAG